MTAQRLVLQGDLVAGERQLDGSQHLTLDAFSADERWRCTLHLVVPADGEPQEAELELTGPEPAVSAALETVFELEREPLRLVAGFGRPTAMRLALEEQDDTGGYELIVDLAAPAAGPLSGATS